MYYDIIYYKLTMHEFPFVYLKRSNKLENNIIDKRISSSTS